jgi:hypothetical protein
VLVDGEVVYRDDRFVHMAAPAAAIAEAQARAREILDKSGLAARLAPEWRA